MAPLLPILEVTVAGFGHALRRFPRLLAIYWLPWLIGAVVLVILEVILQDKLRLGWAPEWARTLVWAPFAAMTYLMLLRWMLCERAPAPLINLDFSRQAWLSAPIVAAWHLAFDALNAAPIPILLWLVVPDPAAFRWEDVAVFYYALHAAVWLINVALGLCCFGLIVVIVTHGWPDLREHWRLLRLRPMHLFWVALLAEAATGGAQGIHSRALAWLGLNQLARDGMIPWRANIHWVFASELANFPFSFLGFAIQGCILAEAYRRLMRSAGEGVARMAPAS